MRIEKYETIDNHSKNFPYVLSGKFKTSLTMIGNPGICCDMYATCKMHELTKKQRWKFWIYLDNQDMA